ncbi:MAG: BACON domain-containing carbohydrate-binding protein [Rikenellaceae bacterium]
MSLILKRTAQYVLPAVMLLVGCSEQEPDSISVVDESGEAITIMYATPTAGFYNVNVVANDWTVASSAEWCIPQKDFGYSSESLEFYVADFEDNSSARTAFLTFVSGMASQTIMVVQESSDNFVNLFPSEAAIDYKSQDVKVTVASNFENWKVTSTSSWAKATANVDGGYFTIAAEENEAEEERSATIYVTFDSTGADVSGTTSAEFVLTQSGRSSATLDLNLYSYTFPVTTESVDVEATTTLYKPTYAVSSSDDSWCTVSDDAAATFTITAVENKASASRTAVVTVIATSEDGTSELMKTIEVTQDGVDTPYVTFTALDYYYTCAAVTDEEISFTYNAGTLSVSSTGCVVSPDVTTTPGTLKFSLAANASTTATQGTITVTLTTAGGETASETITIYQEGYEKLDLSLSISEATIAADGSESVTVSATSSTGTSSTVAWECTTAKSFTTPAASTTFTFDANTSTTADIVHTITATLSENGQEIVKTVTVTQLKADDVIVGYTLSVDAQASQTTIGLAGGAVALEANSNDADAVVTWTCSDSSVTIAAGTLTTVTIPSLASGTETYTITATATDSDGTTATDTIAIVQQGN